MLTENEILDRHITSLKEARDHCLWLSSQQDHDNAAPRGRRYAGLRRALNELEGSARQLGHFRGDARWFRLGVFYAKLMPTVQAKYIGQKWAIFGLIVPTFDNGLRVVNDIAHRPTGVRGLILPNRVSEWNTMPDWAPHAGMAAQGTRH